MNCAVSVTPAREEPYTGARSLEWMELFKPLLRVEEWESFWQRCLPLLLAFLPEVPCVNLQGNDPAARFQRALLCEGEMAKVAQGKLHMPEHRVQALQAALACAKAVAHYLQEPTAHFLSPTTVWKQATGVAVTKQLLRILQALLKAAEARLVDDSAVTLEAEEGGRAAAAAAAGCGGSAASAEVRKLAQLAPDDDDADVLLALQKLLGLAERGRFVKCDGQPVTQLKHLQFPGGLECLQQAHYPPHAVAMSLTPTELLRYVVQAHMDSTYTASLDSTWSKQMRLQLLLPPAPVWWDTCEGLRPAEVKVHVVRLQDVDGKRQLFRASTRIVRLDSTFTGTTVAQLVRHVYSQHGLQQWLDLSGFNTFDGLVAYSVIVDEKLTPPQVAQVKSKQLIPVVRQIFATNGDDALLMDVHWRLAGRRQQARQPTTLSWMRSLLS